MQTEQRNRLLLGALLLVMAVIVYRTWSTSGIAAPPASSAARSTAARSSGAPPQMTAPDVHLDALHVEAPKPGDTDRNLFRFKAKAAPIAPALQPGFAPARPPAPSGPPPPPPLPPIAMKFIGIVEATEHSARIAVLSDERGVYHGREGDIIEGRYRIVHIGVESIEMAYVDGKGRTTIRLSGS